MPLRDAPTPSPEELDQLAEITPGDIERAKERFQRGLAGTPRRHLKDVLEATTDNAGDAAGPLPDEPA
jgi:hypothetical protein